MSSDVVEVSALFGSDVLVLSAPVDARHVDALRPAEAVLVATAQPKRRAEFATARALGHLALARFGAQSEAILNDDQRAPIWPSGFRGSITHCNTRALVALCRVEQGSVGIDVEHRRELKRDLWESVFLAEEIADLEAEPEGARGRLALAMFSAKEALYKAQFPISRTYMGFRALRVRLEGRALHCVFQQDVPPFTQGEIALGHALLAAAPTGEVLTGVRIQGK